MDAMKSLASGWAKRQGAKEAKAGIEVGRKAATLAEGPLAAKAWSLSASHLLASAEALAGAAAGPEGRLGATGAPFHEGRWMREGVLAEARRAQGYACACSGEPQAARAFWAQAKEHLEASARLADREKPAHHLAHWGRMSILHESARLGALVPGADGEALKQEARSGLEARLRMMRSTDDGLGDPGSSGLALSGVAAMREPLARAQALADMAAIDLALGSRLSAFSTMREALLLLAPMGPARCAVLVAGERPDAGWPAGMMELAASAELSLSGMGSRLAGRRGKNASAPESARGPKA